MLDRVSSQRTQDETEHENISHDPNTRSTPSSTPTPTPSKVVTQYVKSGESIGIRVVDITKLRSQSSLAYMRDNTVDEQSRLVEVVPVKDMNKGGGAGGGGGGEDAGKKSLKRKKKRKQTFHSVPSTSDEDTLEISTTTCASASAFTNAFTSASASAYASANATVSASNSASATVSASASNSGKYSGIRKTLIVNEQQRMFQSIVRRQKREDLKQRNKLLNKALVNLVSNTGTEYNNRLDTMMRNTGLSRETVLNNLKRGLQISTCELREEEHAADIETKRASTSKAAATAAVAAAAAAAAAAVAAAAATATADVTESSDDETPLKKRKISHVVN